MPEAIQYKLKEPDKDVEEQYIKEAKRRSEMIATNWQYYHGNHPKPLKKQADNYDDNVIINHIGAMADRIVAFMVGDGVEFDANKDNEQGATDEAIKAIWQANDGTMFANALALSGAIEGHLAVRKQPQDNQPPKLTRIKQSQFSAFWDAFDMERVLWYRLQHKNGGTGRRIDYVRGVLNNEEIDHARPGWVEVVYTLKSPSNTPFGSDDQWKREGVTPWPYEFSPITDWQNIPNVNGYYGVPDVAGAIDLNRALNFILSNIQRIIKHYAAPKTIGTGTRAGDVVPAGVGGFYTVPQADAKIYNLEMQSDLSSSMRMAEIITAGLWESGGMVDPQTIKDRVGTLTNFGLRVLYSDAIKKTDRKRGVYERAFEKMLKDCLAIANQQVPDRIATIWPDVLPEDENEVSNVLLQELERDVISMETYRRIRGYDNDTEIDRLEQEGVTGDIGAGILGLINSNRPFNRGA